MTRWQIIEEARNIIGKNWIEKKKKSANRKEINGRFLRISFGILRRGEEGCVGFRGRRFAGFFFAIFAIIFRTIAAYCSRSAFTENLNFIFHAHFDFSLDLFRLTESLKLSGRSLTYRRVGDQTDVLFHIVWRKTPENYCLICPSPLLLSGSWSHKSRFFSHKKKKANIIFETASIHLICVYNRV